ncbi:MAG: alpha-D-glucose phosphate-specific phosphoglucomutase [Thiohalorhabdus sp.]|uniref:alpha-D-glucose phosphate-specific phosphoglucomutase n=1 Tax=Thiohalorhabdus sp. TaxID=3094134 RepID=UPI00397F1804
MTIIEEVSSPFEDQRPGTSGLRKTVEQFSQPRYLENFIQAVLDTCTELRGGTLILGGDGRYYTETAIDTILRMAAANGVGRVLVGRDGLFSTPAVSATIRRRGAAGGILLTASHNPGGPDGDFGVKYNIANGGPAPEPVTEAIYARSLEIHGYHITQEHAEVDLSREGATEVEGMPVEVIDPVADYRALMAELFDFDALRALLGSGTFSMVFDAMHGVTGPYARAILEEDLGAPRGTVINGEPKPDFAGCQPDPNPVHARDLMERMYRHDAPDFGAASDGDGDRNMIVGRHFFVNPSDSLAVIADHLDAIPGYRGRVSGVARSMPTSRAVDRVAEARGYECFETPTGWKFFGNLLDADRVQLCGEESFGTSSDHVREKDGLWAVLAWLSILAASRESVEAVVRGHWSRYGRDFYSRRDYEGLTREQGERLMAHLRDRLPGLAGAPTAAGPRVTEADEFGYTDPIDGHTTTGQGIRLWFDNGARAVLRLSGTGTAGATLRIYLEKREGDPLRHNDECRDVLKDVAEAVREVAEVTAITGRKEPSLVV